MTRATRTTIVASVRQYVDVDADIDIANLLDEEILACVQEARNRGLISSSPPAERTLLETAMQDIMCRRYEAAIAGIEKAMFDDREDLAEGWRAARRGDWNTAICCLDRFVNPSDLPKPKATPP